MISFLCLLILLLSFLAVYSQPLSFLNYPERKSNSYPFPEMNRFLNSNSRLHHPSLRNIPNPQPSSSLLQYICSIANKRKHIEELLIIFGESYRSILTNIIKQNCSKSKRPVVHPAHDNTLRILFPNSRRTNDKFYE